MTNWGRLSRRGIHGKSGQGYARVMPSPAPALVVDSRGKPCPLPVIDLARAIPLVALGEEVVVLADDPGAKADVPVWCRMKSHEFLGAEDVEVGWRFRVRRAS